MVKRITRLNLSKSRVKNFKPAISLVGLLTSVRLGGKLLTSNYVVIPLANDSEDESTLNQWRRDAQLSITDLDCFDR